MLMYVYSVRDSEAQLFGRPFYTTNAAIATRGFSSQVNQPEIDGQQNDLFLHPESFELYELGTFNDNTGVFELHPQPKPICTAVSVKKSA